MRRALLTCTRTAVAALFVAALAACSKDRSSSAAPDAGPIATAVPIVTAPATLSREQGRALVKGACLSCHSEEMLAQQRLTHAQWTKTVAKMVSWGANLEAKDTEPLTTWLAATYGPDAGPYEPARIDADAAAAELEALPDGPFANGDPERGRTVYTDKCSGCHGPEARGHIGTILVDRPFLHRAPEFAETVRRGRGKMPPVAARDAQIADILAFLREQR